MSVPWLSLRGRAALVCGGSRGIGEATGRALAELGASVTLLARDESRLQRVAEAIGGDYIVADLDQPDQLTATLGNREFHILVNNTGGPHGGLLRQAEPSEFEHAMRRHLHSAQLLVQALLPGMERANYGRIVQVLSTSVREPIDRLGVSNLTRAAMASWAKTLSRELPPGITINNVLPGFTDTERLEALAVSTAARTGESPADVRSGWLGTVPEGRIAQPYEIGRVVAWLATPAASYIRGTSLPVDGGRTRSI